MQTINCGLEKMHEFLLSNGCSFLSKRKGVNEHTGVLLANNLGLEHIGLASEGSGNDRLVVTTKLFFYENPERIKDTFVLVGWTNPARIDYIKNHQKPPWGENWFSLKKKREKLAQDPAWETYKKVHNYENLMARMLRQILEMQDFFENLGIKYCMYHSLNVLPYNIKVELKKLRLLKDRINENRFYKLIKDSQQILVNSDRSRLVISEKDLHPNKEGHLAWYKKIRDFIEKNNLT